MTGKAKLAWWKGKQRWGCTYDGVSHPGMWHSSRCSNKAKHDHDEDGNPTRCGIHCKSATEIREAKSRARYQAQKDKWLREDQKRALAHECEAIVRAIAAGNNDPRSLCADWVKRKAELE